MQVFQTVFNAVLGIFKLPFTIYGYTFSFWQIFLWSAIAAIILWFLYELFGGN